MYAVVETGGKQYQVQEGRYIDVDLLNVTPDTNINIDKVVAIIAGEHSQIGQPYINGATVKAKVLKHDKTKKVIAYKMRRKKGYRLKKGHRQDYTRILIEEIEFPNKEDTVKYDEEQQKQVEKKQQEKEDKIKKAYEKKLAAKEAKKEARKKVAKPEKTKKPEKTETPEPEELEETIIDETTETIETAETTGNTEITQTQETTETPETAETTDQTEETKEEKES
jgi:large subunit ribosomal protein L21